jgi:hypothetical protein
MNRKPGSKLRVWQEKLLALEPKRKLSEWKYVIIIGLTLFRAHREGLVRAGDG